MHKHQRELLSRGIPLQLWDLSTLIQRASKASWKFLLIEGNRGNTKKKPYVLLFMHITRHLVVKAMVVMATGLGKTFVAAESIRRINIRRAVRVLVIAHTNELVYQVERSFWPFLKSNQETFNLEWIRASFNGRS